LVGDPGSPGKRFVRRARGIAIESLAFVLVTALLPVLLPVGALVDLVLWLRTRKHWMALRLVAMAWWFLFGELRGILSFGAIFLAGGWRDTPARRRRVYALRRSWAAQHIAGIRVIFRLKIEVEGVEDVAPTPVLMLIRHASIIDNMVPDAIAARPHGLGLRYVIKRELRMLPTIDIGGSWVPTNFVRRGSTDVEAELVELRKLAIDLEPHEGILIYPEGTRWTPAKLARAQEKIRERQPEIAPLADRLVNLLPPRLGGPVALLEAARGTDVVVCGHVGLDGFEYVSDIWAGGLVGTTVRVRFWRYPASEIPEGREAMTAWLYERWLELDAWVGEQRGVVSPPALVEAGS